MPQPDPAEEFIYLLARHERMVAAYVMTLVPHPQDADDILQEAKVVMWRNFAKFQPGTNFAAWARKVAFHQILAYRKRRKRDRLDFSDEFINAVATEAESSAEHLENREHTLQGCIARLPEDQRQVLLLRYQEGLELEAMSNRLGRTVAALYRQLSRIRQNLHDCVTKSLARSENEFPA